MSSRILNTQNMVMNWLLCFAVIGFFFVGSTAAAMAPESLDDPVSSYDEPRNNVPMLQEGVTGRITAADGRPVVGAMIVPKSLEEDPPAIPEIAITSNADGVYEWALPPGRYEMSVIADGFESETKRVTLGAEEVETVDFHLRRTP